MPIYLIILYSKSLKQNNQKERNMKTINQEARDAKNSLTKQQRKAIKEQRNTRRNGRGRQWIPQD